VRVRGVTAEQTRQRIVDAALELFAERTFAGTTMRDIADQLSLTKAAVYYHFDSKDALLDAILSPLTDSLDALTAHTIAARAALAPGDTVGDIAVKVRTIRTLVEIQVAHLPLMQSILFDPSAIRVVLERRTFTGFNVQFDRAFAGSEDEQVLLQHRCAIGAIHGGLRLTAKAQAHASDCAAPVTAPLQFSSADREVLERAALAVLGITPELANAATSGSESVRAGLVARGAVEAVPVS
jgi:AcrR family transcriptional regulator